MKNTDYKRFKEMIRTTPNSDYWPIWFAGYLWLDLTKRQCAEVVDILVKRGFPVVDGCRGKMVQIPSGFGIFLDQN